MRELIRHKINTGEFYHRVQLARYSNLKPKRVGQFHWSYVKTHFKIHNNSPTIANLQKFYRKVDICRIANHLCM